MSKGSSTAVPFLDLVTPNMALEEEFVSVLREALRTARFVGGPMVEEFEREFAKYCGTRHCIGVGSGTDALRFALIASGLKPGEAVITVANTFIATVEAISQAGGVPVFLDVDEATHNIDAGRLREYLETGCDMELGTGRPIDRRTKKTIAAIVPVHLYGQMADMDVILELAARFNINVIEDACQAHGARYFSIRENRWRTAGSMGVSSAFSFYPGKNLGAIGEAGAVTTDSDEAAERIRMLRDHGQIRKYFHEMEGYNGRLDAIQAGVLSVKLRRLDGWNEKRRALAHNYNRLFSSRPGAVKAPHEPSWSKAVYHLYVIRVENRGAVQQYLSGKNFATGLHYPVPLHLQKAYACMGLAPGHLPVTEKAAGEILSLPMYPGLEPEQQEMIVKHILDLVG